MKSTVTGVSALALILSASALAETKTFEVSDFNEVHFSGEADIEITQGNSEHLRVTGVSERVARLEVDVNGDRLEIRDRGTGKWSSREGTLTIELGVKDIQRLDLAGDATVSIPSLKSDSFDLDARGDTEIEIGELTVNSLSAELKGDSEVEIAKGTTSNHVVEVMGDAEYDSVGVTSDTVEIEIRGDGDVKVNAQEHLDVEVFGDGYVAYAGAPRIKQRVFGDGRIESIDD